MENWYCYCHCVSVLSWHRNMYFICARARVYHSVIYLREWSPPFWLSWFVYFSNGIRDSYTSQVFVPKPAKKNRSNNWRDFRTHWFIVKICFFQLDRSVVIPLTFGFSFWLSFFARHKFTIPPWPNQIAKPSTQIFFQALVAKSSTWTASWAFFSSSRTPSISAISSWRSSQRENEHIIRHLYRLRLHTYRALARVALLSTSKKRPLKPQQDSHAADPFPPFCRLAWWSWTALGVPDGFASESLASAAAPAQPQAYRALWVDHGWLTKAVLERQNLSCGQRGTFGRCCWNRK